MMFVETVPAKITVYGRCCTEQGVHTLLTEQLYLLRLPCTGGVAQNRVYIPFLQNNCTWKDYRIREVLHRTGCTYPSYRTTVPGKITVYGRCCTEQIVHTLFTEQLYLLRLPCTGGVAQNRLYIPFLQNNCTC